MRFLENITYIITLIFLVVTVSYYILLFIPGKISGKKQKFSSITIIIPAHNEEDYIEDAIDSVIVAEFHGKKEIIVVDDGSTDATSQKIRKYKNVKLIQTGHSGKSASINKALFAAKGDLIAIVDGDSCISKNSLEEMSLMLSNDKTAGVCCVVKVKNHHKFVCMWLHIEQIYSSLIRSLFSKINANIVTPGPLSMYKRKELIEIGGFSTNGLSEDIDIAIRLIRKGYKIEFCESAVAETNMPYKIKDFLRQRFRFARGMTNIFKRHLKVNKTAIDIYTLPIFLFSYVQGVIMGIFIIYQMVSGYFVYFASKGIFLSFGVVRFFFEWLSIVGFVRWASSIFSGATPLTLITLMGIISTFLTYPLYLFAIIKYDKKITIWHIIPLCFMFPFWLFIMLVYTIAIPEYFKKEQYNIWHKNSN